METIPTPIDINAPNPEAQPRHEVLTLVAEELTLAYHGIRAFIAERRMVRAGSRMEKTDHKDALYSDLNELARTGQRTEAPTASGKPAMPRTIAERFMDRRLDKRSHKKAVADTYAYRAEKVFNPHPQETLPRLNKRERQVAKMGLKRRLGSIGVKQEEQILAGERRVEATKIDAQPLKFGEQMRKQASKKEKRANRRLGRTVNQPVLSRWRTMRRNRAVGHIQRYHARAEKHHIKQGEIRAQGQSLRTAKRINAAHKNPQVPPRPIERVTYMAEPHYGLRGRLAGVRGAVYRGMSERIARRTDKLEQTSRVDDDEAQYVVAQDRQKQARYTKRARKARLQQLRAKHNKVEVDVTGLV